MYYGTRFFQQKVSITELIWKKKTNMFSFFYLQVLWNVKIINHESLVQTVLTNSQMYGHGVLAWSQWPDMNAVDMLHTAQLPQGHRQLCAAQGAALYQVPNGVASDPYCGADDEQREEQRADGIGDPAVRIELDDQGG